MPILTVEGFNARGLRGGALVIDQVFSLPRVGRLIVDAVVSRDFPVIQGSLLFVVLIYLMISIVVDMLYVVVDPSEHLG